MLALEPRARRAHLAAGDSFDVGQPDDFRVPDAGWHRALPGTLYVPTAAVVLEVRAPDDKTFAKLDFSVEHGADEVLVADPDARTVRCWRLADGAYGWPAG